MKVSLCVYVDELDQLDQVGRPLPTCFPPDLWGSHKSRDLHSAPQLKRCPSSRPFAGRRWLVSEKKSTKRSETSRLVGRESQSQVRRRVVAPSRLVGAPTSREGRRGIVVVLNWRDIECRVRFFGPQVGRGDKSGGSRLVASRDIECRVTLKLLPRVLPTWASNVFSG